MIKFKEEKPTRLHIIITLVLFLIAIVGLILPFVVPVDYYLCGPDCPTPIPAWTTITSIILLLIGSPLMLLISYVYSLFVSPIKLTPLFAISYFIIFSIITLLYDYVLAKFIIKFFKK